MTIKEWLDGDGSYADGLALFITCSRNRNKINYLSRKQDCEKLRYELEKLAEYNDDSEFESLKAPVVTSFLSRGAESERPHERLRVIRQGAIRFQDMPAPVQEVYKQTCDYYRKMRSLHEKLKIASSDSEREKVRNELLEVDELRSAAWGIIDKWAADGSLPEPQVPVSTSEAASVDSPASDAKAVGSARVGIGRDLKALDASPDETKEKELLLRLQTNVKIIQAAGCGFGKNAEKLSNLGLI